MDIVRRTWTEVSLNAIEHNFKEIKSKVQSAKICCVVKADGYGHGAVELAHKLNLKVVSEGVETEEQNQFVIDADCDYIQGFYYHRPIPREEAEKILL